MVPTSLPPASHPDPGSAPWTRLVGDAGDDPAVRAEDYLDIVALAARLADAPIAILAVRDGDGLRVVAQHGLHTAATVIADSHLLHAIGSSRPLLSVADTQQDIRFCDDVLVRTAPGIRFHLGVALHGGNGQCVGVLAVCDTQPRRRGPDAAAAHLGRVSRLAVGLLERHQLQRRSHISTQIMQADFSAVVVVDGSGHVVFVNRAAQAMFGSGARAMRGIPVEVLFPAHLQSDPDAAARWLHATPSTDAAPSAQQMRIADASGSTRTLQAARCVWQVGDGHGVALILRDITEQIEQHQRLQQAALHDALTGVPNRNALVDTLGALLRDDAAPLGVALLNLDNFKAINDTLGHATGDTVLQVTAGRLQAALPDGALLARLGGDEFAMVYPHIAVDALGECLERLLASVSQPCYIDGHVIHMDASIGYTLRDPAEERDALDSSDLIARADLALYKAKAAGGRQLCRFDPKMRQEAIERRRLDLELRRAHADGEFELHYQPQINLDGGRITGAEALLRWRHPERGLLPPIEFIEALSKSPIASSVGRWIVRRGCEDAARWPRVDGREMTISINLFAVQVNDGQLHSVVQHALHDSGLAPERLELEITESIALRPDDTAARMLGRMRACGVKLAFDDFGTGHASLSILQRFPIDRVKIDRSFVRDMIGNRGDAAIVRSIVLISQNLDLDVVAEGVENDHQADMLRGFGCRGAQGFLYSKALEPHAFERWLCDQSGAGAATEAALRADARD